MFETQGIYWLLWLLKAACGVLFAIKVKNVRSRVLGAVGFGVVVLLPLLSQVMMWFGFGWYEFRIAFDLFQFAGWVCILLAFVMMTMPASSPVTAAQDGRTESTGTHPAYYQGPTYHQLPCHPSVNKAFYLGSILGGLGASVLLGLIALMLIADNEDEMAFPLLVLSIMATIYAVIVLATLIHRMWVAIQPGRPRTTPGQAVGFLFIPFFNFYWIFQAYWGWAQDYNRYVGSQSIPAPRMNENIALTLSILAVCSVIPYVGIVIGLVNLVFIGLFFSQVCDALSALATHQQAQARSGGQA